MNSEQGHLFDEAEAEAAIEEETEADQIEVPVHTRQKTRKPAIPDNLPVERVEHVRFKYARRHCDDAGIETARAPAQPIPGSIASPGTLAWVVTSKYCDGLPLYRFSSIPERGQLDISRATLSH
jgi:transposase